MDAPETTTAPGILVFDSGLGGLTVFREVAAARPDARFIYAADDAFFPYGRQDEIKLVARVVEVTGQLIATHRPDLVVVACNTASTLVLSHLREKFKMPFVGTVPAIKPACLSSSSKLVSVLGTEATVKREYTRTLIREHGNNCDVTLVGSHRLAELAEAELKGEAVSDADISGEIAPCFVESLGKRTDTIVLACTHYPLLLSRLNTLAPWSVSFVDPAPAIGRRVLELLGPPRPVTATVATRYVFTSAKAPSVALQAALDRFGYPRSVSGLATGLEIERLPS
jgi:glutamate racemase